MRNSSHFDNGVKEDYCHLLVEIFNGLCKNLDKLGDAKFDTITQKTKDSCFAIRKRLWVQKEGWHMDKSSGFFSLAPLLNQKPIPVHEIRQLLMLQDGGAQIKRVLKDIAKARPLKPPIKAFCRQKLGFVLKVRA